MNRRPARSGAHAGYGTRTGRQKTVDRRRASAEAIATRPDLRYDNGMTAAKIAITLPADQLERVRRAVKRGRADSVSAYIAQALERQDREETLADLLRDLVALHGEPNRKEKAWARRVLRRRSRG